MPCNNNAPAEVALKSGKHNINTAEMIVATTKPLNKRAISNINFGKDLIFSLNNFIIEIRFQIQMEVNLQLGRT